MTDEQLEETWATLEPTADGRRRMDARVAAWLEARQTSLAAEWLGLFGVQPVAALGLVAVSACWIAITPPVVWLLVVLR